MASPVSLDMVEVASSKNATLGAFSPSEQREGARRVQSPEAMAIEGNLAGPTKLPNGSFNRLFFVDPRSYHGLWRLTASAAR